MTSEELKVKDAVEHPCHYQGKHECIEVMRYLFGKDAVKHFCMCNAYKYRFRAGRKDNNSKEQDIAKAEWYEEYLIKLEEESSNELSSKIESLEKQLAELKAQIKAEQELSEQPSRLGVGDVNGLCASTEDNCPSDDERYINVNYYITRDITKADKKDLRERAALRHLRDSLCEGYQFSSDKKNWSVFCVEDTHTYVIRFNTTIKYVGRVYFDTKEHAQQAADWMNKHFKGGERND